MKFTQVFETIGVVKVVEKVEYYYWLESTLLAVQTYEYV